MEAPVTHIDYDNKIVYAEDKNGKKYEQSYETYISNWFIACTSTA